MEYNIRENCARSGIKLSMTYCDREPTRHHPLFSLPKPSNQTGQYCQYSTDCLPGLGTIPPPPPPQQLTIPVSEYSSLLDDDYYYKSSITNQLSCATISSTTSSAINAATSHRQIDCDTMLNYPNSSDDWNISSSNNSNHSDSDSNYLSQSELFSPKTLQDNCPEWNGVNNVRCLLKSNKLKLDQVSFNSVNAQSNVASNTKKRKFTKSSYKHVPHREKPVHLVARRNARERKRVQAVNLAFVRLRKCVPVENRNKRMSKVKTLQRAIEYIAELGSLLQDDEDSASESGSILVDTTTTTATSASTSSSSINQAGTPTYDNQYQLPVSGASFYSTTNERSTGNDHQIMTSGHMQYTTGGSTLITSFNPIEAVHPSYHLTGTNSNNNNKENYIFKGSTTGSLSSNY